MAADERRAAPPRGTRDGRQPSWRVEGAGSDQGRSPRVRWARFVPYLLIVVGLFALNYWIASRATSVSRPRVPYSPFFLSQVRHGNVIDITSKGTAIQGDLNHEVTYSGHKVIRFK